MKAFVVSDDHGVLGKEGEDGLENLAGLLEENNVDMFWHLGDIAPKDLSDEGRDEVEEAYRIYGELIRNLENEGIDYVFVPGNYDQKVIENERNIRGFPAKLLANL
jgi:predicted phosphodiesterase